MAQLPPEQNHHSEQCVCVQLFNLRNTPPLSPHDSNMNESTLVEVKLYFFTPGKRGAGDG